MSALTEHLTPAEVAQSLNTSRTTVHRAIARGDLRAVKYGGLVRIARADFDAFVRQHQTGRAQRRRTA